MKSPYTVELADEIRDPKDHPPRLGGGPSPHPRQHPGKRHAAPMELVRHARRRDPSPFSRTIARRTPFGPGNGACELCADPLSSVHRQTPTDSLRTGPHGSARSLWRRGCPGDPAERSGPRGGHRGLRSSGLGGAGLAGSGSCWLAGSSRWSPSGGPRSSHLRGTGYPDRRSAGLDWTGHRAVLLRGG